MYVQHVQVLGLPRFMYYIYTMKQTQNIETMKTLIKYIITESKSTDSWNEKFYTKKDGTVSIYLDDVEKDITSLYEATRQADGYVYASRIVDMYNESISPLIDLEMDLEYEDITKEEFDTEKEKIFNTL